MLKIKAEIDGSCSIEEAFEQGINIATKLGCRVSFTFNSVECVAHPNGSINEALKQFDVAREELVKSRKNKRSF